MSRAVVDAKEFSHAMSKISKVLKKCAIPILEEVCLQIQNGRCTLTATDLETWLTAELPASGDDMFFAFRKTKDILRACSHFAGELTMEFSETRSGSKKVGRVLLRCERRGAEFEVYDGADYPNTPQASEGDAFSVSSARLSACVERVRYAAEKPSVSARPAAICVQFCGNRVYALDGTRLACDTLCLEELASAPMSIRSLAELPEERYALPDHPIEVNTFKGERFNQKELEQQLRRCNSFAQMMARSELDSGVKRPLLPLSISQIGLIGGSGMINGLIACDTPHIIKGRIVKVIRTESEEKFSAQGNHIGSEVKETITNKMIFNVLTPNGFKALT